MKKIRLASNQLVRWLTANYGLFILAFFTLGFMGSNKTAVRVNFLLDVVICTVSLALSLLLLFTGGSFPLAGKIGLLLTTLCFGAFTWFAFLLPENGLPAPLFN